MVFANLGVSMPVFVLGLLLAFIFAVVLKDTPFVAAAVGPPELRRRGDPARRGLGARGPARDRPAAILDFVSGIYTFSALITGQWAALGRRRSAT